MGRKPNGGLTSSELLMECIPDTGAEELIWMLLMGPNPREGDTKGELSEGLITVKGEPRTLVGLLDAELLGCCVDMAITLPSKKDDVPAAGCQSDTPSTHC